MEKQLLAHVMGLPVGSVTYHVERTPKRLLQESASQYHVLSSSKNGALKLQQIKGDRMNKVGGKAGNLANLIREHVRLGPKISETLKGKLSLGARILRVGGVEKIFNHYFSVNEGEKLFKASQCYLSTTMGPMAGLLFISTDKIAFCSERSIKLSSPTGELIRTHYKVSIPVRKISRANESQDLKRPSQKYLQIVTEDNFDFWFMGFLKYSTTFKHIQKALSQTS